MYYYLKFEYIGCLYLNNEKTTIVIIIIIYLKVMNCELIRVLFSGTDSYDYYLQCIVKLRENNESKCDKWYT